MSRSYKVCILGFLYFLLTGTAALADNIEILEHPRSQTFPTGGYLASVSVVAEAPGSLTYQWYRGEAMANETIFLPIPGATSSTYEFTTGSQDEYYFLRVRVSYLDQIYDSNAAHINISSGPVIIAPPVPPLHEVTVGSSLTFGIEVYGQNITQIYVLLRGSSGTEIVAACPNQLACSIPIRSHYHGSTLNLYVQNQGGMSAEAAILKIRTIGVPAVSVPTSRGVIVNESRPTRRVTVRAEIGGTDPVGYQWLRNGVAIAGSSGTLSRPHPDVQLYTDLSLEVSIPDNNSRISIRLTNQFGTVVSSDTLIEVLSPPIILESPVSLTVSRGSVARFSVLAIGSPEPTYQWFRNDRAIPGATSAAYQFTTTATGNAGTFHVVVSNSRGEVESDSATLIVSEGPAGGPGDPLCSNLLDDDGDGLIDYPADPGCSSAFDETEDNSAAGDPTQCQDGLDNDGDQLIDLLDPDCQNASDPLEGGVPTGDPSLPADCRYLDIQIVKTAYLEREEALDRKLRKGFRISLKAARGKSGEVISRVRRLRSQAFRSIRRHFTTIREGVLSFQDRELLCPVSPVCVQVDNTTQISELYAGLDKVRAKSRIKLLASHRIAGVEKKTSKTIIAELAAEAAKLQGALDELPALASRCQN